MCIHAQRFDPEWKKRTILDGTEMAVRFFHCPARLFDCSTCNHRSLWVDLRGGLYIEYYLGVRIEGMYKGDCGE